MKDLSKTVIEKLYVTIYGDRSAGIFDQSFSADVFIHCGDLAEEDRLPYLNEVREAFTDAYSVMNGNDGKPQVLFDFEVETQP